MASKLHQTVAYIEAMDIGRKISIKHIAKERSISEGTAYHAIKRAEQQGLVVTSPRTGTTRVQPPLPTARPLSPGSLKELTASKVILGAAAPEDCYDNICIGDGSVQDIERMLGYGGTNSLCIVGDRPGVQKLAAEYGAHILLTGSAGLCDEARKAALKKKCTVLQTGYSTFHVLTLLAQGKGGGLRDALPAVVREWMQPPQYLFLDDLTIDAVRMFEKYQLFDIPVVDNEMCVRGSLNVVKSNNWDMSQQVSDVYTPGKDLVSVQETDSMETAAELMALGKAHFVMVQMGDCLTGTLTQKDVLNFYQYYGMPDDIGSRGRPFEPLEPVSHSGKRLYAVRTLLPERSMASARGSNVIISLLVSAANAFCREQNIRGSIRSVNYFLNTTAPSWAELNVALETVGEGKGYLFIECSLVRGPVCYAKATFMVSGGR